MLFYTPVAPQRSCSRAASYPPVLIPTNPDAAFRLSSVLFALGLTAYPIFCSVSAIVDTIRAYRSGQTVEMPLAAKLIALALSLLSIAADGLADSAMRSSAAARAPSSTRTVS